MKILNRPIFQIIINVHNLMINPDDVPTDRRWVFNENGEKVYCCKGIWYAYNDSEKADYCSCDAPKLWYDAPQFDTDELELEKLSKEELIELILKERGKK